MPCSCGTVVTGSFHKQCEIDNSLFNVGIFGKGGEIQTMLCLAFGTGGVTYAGTLSGDIYKWEKNNLVGTVQGHEVLILQNV